MTYYLNKIIHNQWVLTFISMCALFLLCAFCALISDYFERTIKKLLVVTYVIYFPVGLYTCIHCKIVTNEWISKGNEFAIIFLFLTIFMLIILLIIWIDSKVGYVRDIWFFRRESQEYKKSIFFGFALLSNVIASIYTYICFGITLIKMV